MTRATSAPPDQTGGGVLLFDALAYIKGNSDPEESYFRNLYMGVLNAAAPDDAVLVEKMHFENNVIGIADLGSSLVEYAENTFHVTDRGTAPNARIGMLLWQTHGLTVEKNVFTGDTRDQSVGIFMIGHKAPESEQEAAEEPDWSYIDERIYNNAFTNLQAGTLLSGIMRGNAWGDIDTGLEILCGDYTDNLFDIAVLGQTMIRPNQGRQNQLAGNRFYNSADCASNYDWALDVLWNQIPGIYPMELDYKRHELPEDLAGVNCDQWTNFDDIPYPLSGPFVKTEHCGGGVYPIELQGAGQEFGYQQSKTLLHAALATYQGLVDLGQTPDVKDAIEEMSPPRSTTYLRDLLLASHPLSDEVLVAMLKRLVPMDPWHQTQVLLQNSRLNAGVWAMIQDNGLLTPYFRALVAQAQGEGGPTMKQALEMEIVERRQEMTGHIKVLGTLYARDTVDVPQDSLRKLFRHELDKQFLQKRLEWLIADRDLTAASDLLSNDMTSYNGREVMADLIALEQSSAGNWENLSGAERNLLQQHAAHGKVGAPRAAGILYSIGETAPLPEVTFPDFTKSRSVGRESTPALAEPEPAVACFPNPAGERTFVTYPSEVDGAMLLIHDTRGMLTMIHPLKGNGLFELDLRNLAEGLYHVSVSGTHLAVKLTVQH